MMKRSAILLVAAILLTVPVRAQSSSDIVYTDITTTAGVGQPFTLNESLAWGDYDGDGDQDLYLTNNGPNKLFRNDGGGTFTDVSVTAGVGHAGFSVGTAWGDMDNDGDLDLYVVSFGSGPDVLYRNDGPTGLGGEHVFTDIAAAAGITDESSSRGVALLDYDRDGLLDIYVNAVGPDILYQNLGSLTFANVAGALGVDTPGTGVGAVATDVDGNGWIDLFTGNRTSDLNRLYVNDLGVFTDITVSAGIDRVGLGMGVHASDYDNDLDFDLYWTVWPGSSPTGPEPNAFYENLTGTAFANVTPASMTGDPDGWGISDNAGDVDNDGWEDFFVTNGFTTDSTPSVLFRNDGGGTFSDVTSVLGGVPVDGRGVAFADIDDDGDVDLCVTGALSDETQLWRNDTSNGHHWITLDLRGTCSNRSAIGARVEVTTNLIATAKEVSGGAGRGSQNSLPLEFGLGAASAIWRVDVYWPSGYIQTLENVAMDQVLPLTEPCSTLTLMAGADHLFWAQPSRSTRGAFDVVRGDLGILASTGGDFEQATLECLSAGQPQAALSVTGDPPAGAGHFYLVRDGAPEGSGTYDTSSPSQVGSRDAEIAASPGSCS